MFSKAIQLCILSLFGFLILSCGNRNTVETLPDRSLVFPNYGIEIELPAEEWAFLEIPNTLLQYPQSIAQISNSTQSAFGVLIPEERPESNIDLAEIESILVRRFEEELENVEHVITTQVESTWSERTWIEFQSKLGNRDIRWLVQVDLSEQYIYRMQCWTTLELYEMYKADFYHLLQNIKPI